MTENLTFDLVTALNLISNEDDLRKTFTTKFPLVTAESFPEMVTAAKSGKLEEDKANFVIGLYENVILKRKAFVEKYVAIYSNATILASTVTPKVKKVTKPKVSKVVELPTKNSKVKLPKEYNKTRVMEDIAARGDSKPNEFEMTVLAGNDLKNIYYELNAKFNRMRYLNTNELSEADCRDIVAGINTLKKKLAHLIKKR